MRHIRHFNSEAEFNEWCAKEYPDEVVLKTYYATDGEEFFKDLIAGGWIPPEQRRPNDPSSPAAGNGQPARNDDPANNAAPPNVDSGGPSGAASC